MFNRDAHASAEWGNGSASYAGFPTSSAPPPLRDQRTREHPKLLFSPGPRDDHFGLGEILGDSTRLTDRRDHGPFAYSRFAEETRNFQAQDPGRISLTFGGRGSLRGAPRGLRGGVYRGERRHLGDVGQREERVEETERGVSREGRVESPFVQNRSGGRLGRGRGAAAGRVRGATEAPFGFHVRGAAAQRKGVSECASHGEDEDIELTDAEDLPVTQDSDASVAPQSPAFKHIDVSFLRVPTEAFAQQSYGLDLSEADVDVICAEAQIYLEKYHILGRPTSDTSATLIVSSWLNHRLSFFKALGPTKVYIYPPQKLLAGLGISAEQLDYEAWRRNVEEESQYEAPKTMAPHFAAGVMTPQLGQFLNAINGFVKEQNESSLAEYLVIEPPFNPTYQQMIQELQQAYPKGSEDALEEKCNKSLTVANNGSNGSATWTMFIKFMAQYLSYLRDVDADPNKYLETYELLYELQKRANSALAHPYLGQIMTQTVIACAKLICRLAIGLDKQPELIAHLKSNKSGNEDGGRETLPERAAESIRQALTTCLNDRSSDLDQNGRPEGKKRGIYIIANICLKIFFQCRKTRNAEMIFTTIRNNSPPLAAYPKRERVTYLYYLGRYWFQNNHFHRAQLALHEAYNESPVDERAIRQRRHILVYLITCNIIMGRFPSNAIFQRPEAQSLRERFMPIMQAIRSGNLALFRQYLDLDGPNAPWFLHFRILLQLRNRCEVLVWRSLIRKVWILNGTRYETSSKAAPLVGINDLVLVFRYLERQAQKPQEVAYIDPDLDGDEEGDEDPDALLPTLTSLESILSSLVSQGFLRGFIAHRLQKFVFSGVKQAGGDVLAAGFPSPWKVIQSKVAGMNEVPGWKKAANNGFGMATGGLSGGMVVNLSGARAAGAA